MLCIVCKSEVRPEELMCRTHWSRVSPSTKRWVYEAWRRRVKVARDRDAKAIPLAIREHALAKQAAYLEASKADAGRPAKKQKLPL